MKNIDKITNMLKDYMSGKSILEIACGDAFFSISASRFAAEVIATDISLERIHKRGLEDIPDNIEFSEMNAVNLSFPDNRFNVSICYNSLAHLGPNIFKALRELRRVAKVNGHIILASTWKLDNRIINFLQYYIKIMYGMCVHSKVVKKDLIILIIRIC